MTDSKNILQEMYNQIPEAMLKHAKDNDDPLTFKLSQSVYNSQKKHIIDGMYKGLEVYVNKKIANGNAFISAKEL